MTESPADATKPVPRGPEASGRDRDAAGRPRNARPRDALGRPLSRSARGEPRVPDDLTLPPAATLAMADQLLAAGRPFHAHEVLEARWKTAPPEERALWQGLTQIAVGLTHAGRGNARGAVALLRRGVRRLRDQPQTGQTPTDRPDGGHLDGVIAAAEALADRIEHHGLADVPSAQLRLRLCRGDIPTGPVASPVPPNDAGNVPREAAPGAGNSRC